MNVGLLGNINDKAYKKPQCDVHNQGKNRIRIHGRLSEGVRDKKINITHSRNKDREQSGI